MNTPPTTPVGHLLSLVRALRRHARYGDVQGFRAYVRSPAFLANFVALDPERRRTAMLVYVETEALCEAKSRSPLPKPKTVAEGAGLKKANWRDPVMLAKLRQAKSDEAAARACQVTLDAARIARKRYAGVTTTNGCALAA